MKLMNNKNVELAFTLMVALDENLIEPMVTTERGTMKDIKERKMVAMP
ncbi:MAG: hypothetical protein R3312_03660 [Gammaproteobacteria bacterium]|nr:hypothetical protein [Gammaproteobacteria bacterium]